MDRQITVAHLMPWSGFGGVEVATVRLISATSKRFRHVAFCLPDAADAREACEQAGATVIEYVMPEPSLRHASRFYKESARLARQLRQEQITIAHCAETKAAYHNSLATLIAGVPLITHVRSRYATVSFRERLTFLPIKQYIFVSKDSRQQFGLKLPDDKVRVLYDAVEFSELSPEVNGIREEFKLADNTPLIGMVARVNPQKDYDTLADAAAIVLSAQPDARFMVVGDNSHVPLNRTHYAKVRARLKELGIEDKFIFTGFRSDVSRIMSAFDVFVLCTHREGLPLAVLEAMAIGKPVIATAVDGVPEMIDEGVTGLMHPHQDSTCLASKILKCIQKPEWAKSIGLAGRAKVRGVYNVEIYARNVAAIYDEVLTSEHQ